jgi:hypothetical protein
MKRKLEKQEDERIISNNSCEIFHIKKLKKWNFKKEKLK